MREAAILPRKLASNVWFLTFTEVGGYVLCADKLEERYLTAQFLGFESKYLSQIKMKAKQSGNTPLPAKDNALGTDSTYVR